MRVCLCVLEMANHPRLNGDFCCSLHGCVA